MLIKNALFSDHNLFWRLHKLRTIGRFYASGNILKLGDRGLVQELFPPEPNEILKLITKGPQTVYAGFDPTASSLHIGNLLVLIKLLHWYRGGHAVVAVVGGATGLIGDPSGHSKERPAMLAEIVKNNSEAIAEQIRHIFHNHETYFLPKDDKPKKLFPIRILNNLDWYQNMNALEFLAKVGKSIPVGPMLRRHCIKSRMETDFGISFTEFSYQILQAYDWLHLFRNFNCKFQVGGNDQIGNITAGFELIKKLHHVTAYGFTLPLIKSKEGNKYGKSSVTPVWLSKTRTSPFKLYQFFLRTTDSDVEKFLLYFTFNSINTISEIMEKHKENPEKLIAQRKLAEDITILIHGEESLRQAEEISSILYKKNVEVLMKLSPDDFSTVFEGAEVVPLMMKPGTTILELAMGAKCFETEVDAIKMITQGAFYVNYQKVTNVEEVLTRAFHILPNNVTLVRKGKKHYTVVKWI